MELNIYIITQFIDIQHQGIMEKTNHSIVTTPTTLFLQRGSVICVKS